MQNTLARPEGPDCEFLTAEGRYILRDELTLAPPPPHPSDPSLSNANPLATTPQPPIAGSRVSLISIAAQAPPLLLYNGPSATTLSLAGGVTDRVSENPCESRSSNDAGVSVDGSGTGNAASTVDESSGQTGTGAVGPVFGEADKPKDISSKRKKPKSNMSKSNSTFISRVVVSEHLTRKLQNRPADGWFAFVNINRVFEWLDLSSPITKGDCLAKILFSKAHCICHDVNNHTKTQSHIDVVMGFSTGDILWWEPMSQRYTRINKNCAINTSPVLDVRWLPASENLFIAAHQDGTLVVYDKEKEDGSPNAEDDSGETNTKPKQSKSMRILKSVHLTSRKTNPVAVWKLSNQPINMLAFSPDKRHLAVVSENGTLRIIDYQKEELLDMFNSYYGGLTCVCWSPDGKYVLTGGQDDLISIWCVAESALLARCQGHQSFVTAVAFDPWRCDNRNYRFGSVGEDRRLCLWDFSVGMLHRSRAQSKSASTPSQGGPQAAAPGGPEGLFLGHPVDAMSKTTILPPVLEHVIDPHPVIWMAFTEDSIMTSCDSGHIRTWERPSVFIDAEQDAVT